MQRAGRRKDEALARATLVTRDRAEKGAVGHAKHRERAAPAIADVQLHTVRRERQALRLPRLRLVWDVGGGDGAPVLASGAREDRNAVVAAVGDEHFTPVR